MDKGIKTDPVYDEELDLCVSKKLNVPAKATTDFAFYEKLSYIDYQEEQSVLSLWIKHHTQVKGAELDVRVYVMDAQAVSRMIMEGLGAGVLPGHLVSKLVEQDTGIQVLKGSNKPLFNTISMAYLEEKTLSTSAKAVFDFLRVGLKKR